MNFINKSLKFDFISFLGPVLRRADHEGLPQDVLHLRLADVDSGRDQDPRLQEQGRKNPNTNIDIKRKSQET